MEYVSIIMIEQVMFEDDPSSPTGYNQTYTAKADEAFKDSEKALDRLFDTVAYDDEEFVYLYNEENRPMRQVETNEEGRWYEEKIFRQSDHQMIAYKRLWIEEIPILD